MLIFIPFFYRQTLFGAVFVSVGENVLQNQLTSRLRGISGIDVEHIQSTGATNILNSIDVKYRYPVLEAYNDALRVVFQMALCMASIAVPGALVMEWRSVKKNRELKHGGGSVIENGRGNGTEIGHRPQK